MSDSAFRPGAAPAGTTGQAPGVSLGRMGSRLGRIDPDAIARAEAALKSLSSQFGQWLNDELSKLEAARAAVHATGVSRSTIDQIYTHAHDLKGLGSTYEFPIVTQIAGSLCRLLGEGETRLNTPLELIDAHIDAIGASVRGDIKTADTPEGRAMVDALEPQVDRYLQTL